MPEITLKKVKSDYVKCKIQSSKDAFSCIKQFYYDDLHIYESFFILLLNIANNTIGYAKISQGGVSGTVVDNKLIAKYALDSFASSIILAHNHPSEGVQPSQSDLKLTRKIKDAMEILDIKVLDHIILGEEIYYSFADEGVL